MSGETDPPAEPSLPTEPTQPTVVAGEISTPEPPADTAMTVAGDDAILPATSTDDDLRDAVGIQRAGTDSEPSKTEREKERDRREKERKELRERDKVKKQKKAADDHDGHDHDGHDHDDDHHDKKPRSHRALIMWSSATTLVIVVGIVIFLGRMNTDRYLITCEPEEVIAEQGRVFPPWGSHQLGGAEWKPIAIPPNAECKARETDNPEELAGWYLDELVDQASTSLNAKEVTKVDLAAQQLEQALLLARSPDRRDQRKEIERLLGDVDYWRASAKLHDAQSALLDAAKEFETAASKRPRHVADSAAWGSFVRKIADELHGGPSGAASLLPNGSLPSAAEQHVAAPLGSALPVEPPSEGSNATTPPDAGVQGGGVLL